VSDTVIHVENVAKRYLIQHQATGQKRASGKMLSERIQQASAGFSRFFRRGGEENSRATETEEFWALKDVSFEVRRGEVLGIVGRNGAGKSTLLKILSRITEPTRGEIRICGRVASLLEVGTGFHPELSGRENIFLNGAIMGMQREQIRSRFDEIVAFAEVEKFLDTPVKYYSSGMYVRLAFAVAAHLEPDILIVDEVLAVGDMAFQKKCLAKMESTTQQGRTVLLVSHNMPTVLSLCNRAILLSGGCVAAEGVPARVLDDYQRLFKDGGANTSSKDGDCILRRAWIGDDPDAPQSGVPMSRPFDIHFEWTFQKQGMRKIVPYLQIDTEAGQCVCHINPDEVTESSPGLWRATCRVPAWYLNAGGHMLSLWVTAILGDTYQVCAHEPMALTFTLFEDVPHPSRHSYAGPTPGAVWPRLDWQVGRMD
jgi:lipopolysaccharide transport system ATP-binding protein